MNRKWREFHKLETGEKIAVNLDTVTAIEPYKNSYEHCTVWTPIGVITVEESYDEIFAILFN